MMGASAAAGEAANRLKFIKKALLDTPKADPRLLNEADALEKRLKQMTTELYGDQILRSRSEPMSPSLIRRVSAQLNATAPITTTVKRNYEIAAADFAVLEEKLRQLIEVELKKLEQDAEAAGAPWTPGRGVPQWKDR
jgi:hypothetical protein